jgi:NADH-quinone oxidoreductase subunit C/D
MNFSAENSAHTDFWTSLSSFLAHQLKRTHDKSATAICKRDQWLELHRKLHTDWGFFFFFDLYLVDQKDLNTDGERFLLVSQLIHLENFLQLTMETTLDVSDTIESLVDIWPQSIAHEDEITQRFGVSFGKKKDNSHSLEYFMRKDWGGGLNKSSSNQVQLYDYQTNRDGIVTEFEFTTEAYCLGYEKLAEQMPLPRFLPCLEKINPGGSAFYSLALCRLVEEAQHIQIPEREQALRMVLTELNRVLDHMSYLYQLFIQLEFSELSVKCLKAREIILRLLSGLCGKRTSGGLITIGGLSFELKMGWVTDCSKHVEALTVIADQLLSATSRSWQWMNMTRIDPTSAKDALKFGVTGPALRACGVNYDLRKIEPYYFYSDLAFEVPMGINGDIYDRGLVRIEEMRESLKIIFQLIDNLPRNVSDELDIVHAKNNLSYLDKLYKMNSLGQLGAGTYNLGIESSNGHLGLSLRSNGSEFPYRLRVRTPSAAHKEFLQLKCHGVDSEDIELILSSYNISIGEMER